MWASRVLKSLFFALELERRRLVFERMMLSDKYAITTYYHGKGKRLARSTRISERRWMLERIRDIVLEARARQRAAEGQAVFQLFVPGPVSLAQAQILHRTLQGAACAGHFPGKRGRSVD